MRAVINCVKHPTQKANPILPT